jgi:hypothetical protein
MFKLTRKDRTAHTKQKPRPRFVSKAHRLESEEQQAALAAASSRTTPRMKKPDPEKR